MTQVMTDKTAVKTVEIANPTVAISITDLVNILFQQNRTTFIGFDSITEPTMNKKGNRFLCNVEKLSTVNALTGYQYESMVNNAHKREIETGIRQAMLNNGVPENIITAFENDMTEIIEQSHEKFESAGLSWGQYMVNPITGKKSRILIDHTKKDRKTQLPDPSTYAMYAQVAILQTKTPVYRWKDTGIELTETEIAEMKTFFPKKKEGSRQGLIKPYIIRTYSLNNLMGVRINKQRYTIVKSAKSMKV